MYDVYVDRSWTEQQSTVRLRMYPPFIPGLPVSSNGTVIVTQRIGELSSGFASNLSFRAIQDRCLGSLYCDLAPRKLHTQYHPERATLTW